MEMDMESNDPLTDWDRHLDILDWWKSNSGEYPILASMARDALAVPASTSTLLQLHQSQPLGLGVELFLISEADWLPTQLKL
jgi:hypothetical protein